MARPALKLEPIYRSGTTTGKGEVGIAAQLTAAGLPFTFEELKLKYTVPEKEHTYTPDFQVGNIVIEHKGAFGYGPTRHSGDPVKERQKLIHVKQQHPELDLRIIFERANGKIRKGSPTTFGMWATKNGFKWADKSTIPLEWIKEMQQQLKD